MKVIEGLENFFSTNGILLFVFVIVFVLLLFVSIALLIVLINVLKKLNNANKMLANKETLVVDNNEENCVDKKEENNDSLIEKEEVEEVVEERNNKEEVEEETKEVVDESNNNDIVEEKHYKDEEIIIEEVKEDNKRTLAGKFEVFPVGDVYLYRLKASNGEILVVSEMYKNEKGALLAIESVKRNIDTGSLQIYQDKHNLWQFKLFTSNKRLLVASANYSTQASCEYAANSFKKFAKVSPVVTLQEDPEHLIEEVDLEVFVDKKSGKIVVSQIQDEYEFKLYASNGVVLCTSATYKTKTAVLNCVSALKEAVKNGKFYIIKDKNSTYQFKLYTITERCIVVSEAYKNKAQAVSAANSVASFVTLAEIIDKTLEEISI